MAGSLLFLVLARTALLSTPTMRQAGELPARYPRLATLYSKGDGQNKEATQQAIARFGLYVGDMVNWHTPSAADRRLTQGQFYRAVNPTIVSLIYFHATLFPESETEYAVDQFIIRDVRYYVDPSWYLTYAGSTLGADASAETTELEVADLGSFAEGDRVLVGGVSGQSRAEVVRVRAKSTDRGPGSLSVDRGLMGQGGRFGATQHLRGEFARTVAHAFGDPDAMVMNVLPSAPRSGVNPTLGEQTWSQFAASFLALKLGDPGYASIDGYFLDNFLEAASLVDLAERVDASNGNVASGIDEEAWRAGMLELAGPIREALPTSMLLVGNSGGRDPTAFGRTLNGGMIEGIDDRGSAGLQGTPAATRSFYLTWLGEGRHPATFIVNGSPRADTVAAGATAYQTMRYLLTLTLMGDGFFSFDEVNINGGHQTLWWFDEYDGAGLATGYLGRPLAEATSPAPGVYRRDFEHGVALSNTSDVRTRVELGGSLERLKGAQVPAVNAGGLVDSIMLEPRDGIILLRPSFRHKLNITATLAGLAPLRP